MNIFNLVKTAENIKLEFRDFLKTGLNIEKLEKFFQKYWKFFNPNLTDNRMENYILCGGSSFVLSNLIKMLEGKLFSLSSEETIQTLEGLFEKISNYPIFYYPIFIRTFYKNDDLIKDWICELNKNDYPLLYIWCYMFKNLLSNLTNEELILNFIRKTSNLSEERIAKHLIIYAFASTKKISWEQKRKLFWEWGENPLFLLKEENPLFWTQWPESCCENPQIFKKCLPVKKHLIPFCDLYLLLKEIKEDVTNEDRKMFQEKVFKNFIDYLNSLNSKIYEDFWSNSESLQRLIEIGLLLSKAEFWNKIIKGLIPYDQKNGKKNEELYKIYILIETLINEKEIKKEEVEKTEAGETPDFTLITQSKKIGIEIVRYDTPEQMKRIAEQEICPSPKPINFNIPEIFSARVKERIKNKIHKLKNKKSQYDELWLYLVPYSEEAFTETILAKTLALGTLLKKIIKEIRLKLKGHFDFFSKIYLLIGGEIHELSKEKEYSINGTLSKVTNFISRKIQNLN